MNIKYLGNPVKLSKFSINNTTYLANCQEQKMPKKGYVPTPEHRNKIREKAKLRPNGWLGRKHRLDSRKKMAKPHTESHKEKIKQSVLRWWASKRPVWYVAPPPKVVDNPPLPQYHDIYDDGWNGIKDVL